MIFICCKFILYGFDYVKWSNCHPIYLALLNSIYGDEYLRLMWGTSQSEREYGGWMVDTWRKEHSKWIWWKWIWCSLGSVRISDESNKWKLKNKWSGTQRWKWIWYLTKVTVEGESLKVFLDRPHWSDKNVHLNIFITYQATSKCGIGSHPKNLCK